jgi:prepilin-type N-terminal cleavage/methylation domain-containing protein
VSRGRANSRPGREGFTLVELLLGIALASIFAAALYGFFFAGLDSARSHQTQAIAQSSARTAIDRAVREARQAVSPDDGLTPPVVAMTPTSLEMFVDPARATGATTPRPQKVRYRVTGTQLVRERALPVGATPPFAYGAYGAREVLVEGLTNGAVPVFRAVTAEGVPMSASVSGPQARDIAQISVRLRVAQRTGNAATTLELHTDVALRNAIRI